MRSRTGRDDDGCRYTFENTGGFEGGVFQNVAVFNPTEPIKVTDATGTHYFEIGTGRPLIPSAAARIAFTSRP